MRNRNHLNRCLCDSCGSSYELFYDTKADEYICSECLDKEQKEINKQIEDDDQYPLDMTFDELAKWRNS
jgi:hypothetical protein